MCSAGDEERTAASGEQIRPQMQEGCDAELASLQLQVSRLAALVEKSIKKKEPGSVVADAASRGGWVAAPRGQREEPTLPLGGGGGFLQQQTRDSGQGPRSLLEGGWASRSGANPVGPAGVGPGIGPDYGEARGLNPPGLDGQLIGNNERHAPVGNPNVPSSELYRLQYTSDEVQRGLQAFHFVTTAIVREADKAIVNKCETAKEILAELDKIYDPESQGSKQALMKQMFNFTIPTHSSRNPIEHRSSCSTALDSAEIVRIVRTVHASLPEGRKASKGQRRAEHALLASDATAAAATKRGEGVARRLVAAAEAATTMRVACAVAVSGAARRTTRWPTAPRASPCDVTCKGYGRDKSKCPTEGAVLVVEAPVEGASANATALDVAEEALVVGGISGECHKVVGRGGVEQVRRGRYVAHTGATTHMFANSDGFVRYEEFDRRVRVAAG
ncbi:unnamed protein product [Ectocarpus sp. CCAP 1310/34]|nr:unnamed protein product [Ectocarpus sp. CCAP 1310/34]